jgi:hypothetical protein
VKRFQVADAGKDFGDKGPDLFRAWNADKQGDECARARVKNIVPESHDLFWRTGKRDGGWSNWKGNAQGNGLDRGHVLGALDDWAAAPAYDKQVAQVGVRKADESYNVTAKCKALLINVGQYGSATDRAEQTWAMYDRAWPQTTFAGIYVCKPYSHGYGDAVDVSYGPTPAVFDWGLRMSKAGLLVCEQIIGTKDGQHEVEAWARTGFAIESYGGNGSHTWHVHHSCGHATDANPPCMD